MARPTAPKIAQRVKVSILPSSDAKESVELDYRMMIPGNFSRSEPGSLGQIKDRRLRVIANKGDYQRVLKDINPKLKLSVSNKLSDDPEAKMEVNLDFKEILFEGDEPCIEEYACACEFTEYLEGLNSLENAENAELERTLGSCVDMVAPSRDERIPFYESLLKVSGDVLKHK